MNRKQFFITIALLAAFIAAAPPVWAHANLVKSEPPANSAQPVPPRQVQLWFSEAVEASFTQVQVLNTSGAQVDNGDSRRTPDDNHSMVVSLPELPKGLYTVAWQAISAVDGHHTSGSFSFTVGDAPLSDATPRELMSLVDTALSAAAPPPAYDVLARWLNLLLLTALAGSFAFPLVILLPALRSAQAQQVWPSHAAAEEARAAWTRRWLRWVWLSFALYIAAMVGMLMAQSITSGGLHALGRVLTSTRFGTIWLLRIGLLGALGVLVFRASAQWQRELKADRALWLAALLNLLLLWTHSLNSHNAAINNPPFLALAVDFIHLLGTVIWIGGLAQLLVSVSALLRPLEGEARTRVLAIIIARFSFIAFLTVNVIILSGLYVMYVQVGSLEALFETFYGQSLLVKIVLVGVVMAIAAFNLIVVRPNLAQISAERALSLTRQLSVATVMEALVGVAILMLVAVMTSVAPAQGAYDPAPKLVMQTQQVDDLLVTIGIKPGLVGSNDFDVKVRDLQGRPISDATVVRILGTMLDMEMGTQETTAEAQGNGHYTLHADLLSMTGRWNLEVLVRRAGEDDARPSFTLVALDKRTPTQVFSLEHQLEHPQALVGLGLTMLALTLGTASVLLLNPQRRARWLALSGALGVAVLGLTVVLQATQADAATGTATNTPRVPAEARAQRSPVTADSENLLAGQKIYQQYCTACHGAQGKGNGPLAASLNPKPADLTVHARLHTEGEAFWIISTGVPGTAMPRWEDQLSELQRWQVVAFIRTLGLPVATPPRSTPP